ncbi:glycosyltransferase family 52 [Vibrio splendidus]
MIGGKIFYVETNYQFLVSLSIIFSEEPNLDCNVTLIDATEEGLFFLNKDLLENKFGFSVISLPRRSFYVEVLTAFFKAPNLYNTLDGSFLYIFNNRSPIVNRLSSLFMPTNVSIVEEGLSLYRKSNDTKGFRLFRFNVKKAIISCLTNSQYTDIIGRTKYASTLYLKYPDSYSNRNYYHIKKLQPLSILNEFSNELASIFNCDLDIPKECGDRVAIFFGQPLSELGIVDRCVELNNIKMLHEVLYSKGITLLIKPHPIDTNGKYDGISEYVLPSSVPSEVMLATMEATVDSIFTYYSTAAINASVSLDIPAYFLLDILDVKSIEVIVPPEVNAVFLKDLLEI